MNRIEESYAEGMARVFANSGISKVAAVKSASYITELKKTAEMFNFSDSNHAQDGGISWSSIVIPLLAATAAGYIGYNARDKGSGRRSAFDNVKNYLGGIADKYIRRSRPRPLYDIRDYFYS